ncbi:MAG TPA: LacI family DNA-binding transcriptional regulator, partial [Acidothermaceae bacterium]
MSDQPSHVEAPNAPRVHIRDVARAAGVSHTTVSRVLNDHPSVIRETRQRVLDSIRQLNYRPSSTARALATGRSLTFGVIIFDATQYGPAATLNGIGAAAREAGYSINVAVLRSSADGSAQDAIDRLAGQGVDGIIVIASEMSVARTVADTRHRVPMVGLNDSFDVKVPAVKVDESGGGRQATQYLLQLGHATVWHIAGPTDSISAAGRVAGWMSALQTARAPVPTNLIGDWTAASGYRRGLELARLPEVTAIFAANDQMALGVLHALYEVGRRVPEDVSVVGFDDVPEAAYYQPALSSVRPDFAEVGRQ